MSDSADQKSACREDLRVEYAATNDAYMHYDNFSWQVGTVLIAGVFVFWGFVLSADTIGPRLWFAANSIVCAIMTVWLLYVTHNRQVYLFKLHRLHEIEDSCGMRQHRRFNEWPIVPQLYVIRGPSGHKLDQAAYTLISLSGPLLHWAGSGSYYSFLIGVPVAFVLYWVHSMDKQVRKRISTLWQNTSTDR